MNISSIKVNICTSNAFISHIMGIEIFLQPYIFLSISRYSLLDMYVGKPVRAADAFQITDAFHAYIHFTH